MGFRDLSVRSRASACQEKRETILFALDPQYDKLSRPL